MCVHVFVLCFRISQLTEPRLHHMEVQSIAAHAWKREAVCECVITKYVHMCVTTKNDRIPVHNGIGLLSDHQPSGTCLTTTGKKERCVCVCACMLGYSILITMHPLWIIEKWRHATNEVLQFKLLCRGWMVINWNITFSIHITYMPCIHSDRVQHAQSRLVHKCSMHSVGAQGHQPKRNCVCRFVYPLQHQTLSTSPPHYSPPHLKWYRPTCSIPMPTIAYHDLALLPANYSYFPVYCTFVDQSSRQLPECLFIVNKFCTQS